MSLRARLLLGYIVLVAGSFFLVMHLIQSDIRPRYLESAEDSIVDTAELLAALLAQDISVDGKLPDNLAGAMEALAQREFSAKIYQTEKRRVLLRVYVTNADGVLLYDSTGGNKPGDDFSRKRDVFLTLQGKYGARSTRDNPDDPSSSVMYVAAPVLKNGRTVGVVAVGKPPDSVSLFVAVAHKRLGLVFALAGFTVIGFAALLTFWITRPVKRLTAYVRSVRQGAPPALPRLGSPELAELGRAIADMQSELEGKNYIEDYVRALTHEMKSPLTGIKGATEILRGQMSGQMAEKFLSNIESAAGRMQNLVERMLDLSRLENARSIAKAPIPAAAFCDDIALSFQLRLESKKLRLETRAAPNLALYGDALLLRQAIDNLIANAVDFAPPGSVITLAVEAAAHTHVVSVADQGPGMPEFALAKAFDKFFSLPRPDGADKSTGLGLPFVKEVVALHGGDVTLTPLSPGLLARIILPAGPAFP